MDTTWSETRAARWDMLVEEVRRRLGPGAPLTPTSRRFFEGQLGSDTGGVMVHRGPFAGYLASGLQADAATMRGHVFGPSDALSEDTAGGVALLGHEVTHASSDLMIQRALDAPGEEPESDAEERQAEAMESAISEIVATAETEQQEEREPRRVQAPIDGAILAERVYQRLMDAARLDRQRGAW